MPKRKSKQQRPDRPQDPRFAKFADLYVQTGKQKQSAIDAGYSESYSHSKAHELAARVKVTMAVALRAAGLDEVQLARRIVAKLDAQTVKWNPNRVVRAAAKAVEAKEGQPAQPELVELRGDWDKFEAHETQQRAQETVLELLDAFPARRIAGKDGGDLFAKVIIESSIKRPAPRAVKP